MITGGASGIGAASGRLFAAEGAKVAIAEKNRVLGEETAAIVARRGGVRVVGVVAKIHHAIAPVPLRQRRHPEAGRPGSIAVLDLAIGNTKGEVFTGTASTNYFDLMKIPVVRGRGFRDQDQQGAAPIAVVNEAFVRRWMPDPEPPRATPTPNGGGLPGPPAARGGGWTRVGERGCVTARAIGVVVQWVGSWSVCVMLCCFFFNDTATTEIYTRSLVGSVRCV